MMERLRSLMLVALLLALFNDGAEAVLSNFSAFNKEVAAIASHPVTDDDHKVLEAAVTVGPAGYTRDASLASGEFSDSSDMLGVVLNADGSVQDGQPALGDSKQSMNMMRKRRRQETAEPLVANAGADVATIAAVVKDSRNPGKIRVLSYFGDATKFAPELELLVLALLVLILIAMLMLLVALLLRITGVSGKRSSDVDDDFKPWKGNDWVTQVDRRRPAHDASWTRTATALEGEDDEVLSQDCLPVPESFKCPITQEIMSDPVSTVDGLTYDRESIATWFRQGQRTSPLTNRELPSLRLVENVALRGAISEFCSLRPELKRKDLAQADFEAAVELREAEVTAQKDKKEGVQQEVSELMVSLENKDEELQAKNAKVAELERLLGFTRQWAHIGSAAPAPSSSIEAQHKLLGVH